MRRIQSYIINVDIAVPVADSDNSSGQLPALLDAAREVKQATTNYVDLVTPFNLEVKQLFPDYTHPTEVTITKNPLYPFVVDEEILALQDSMPFEDSLEQQSIYNGDINVEVAAYLVALDGELSNPDIWALDQSVATEVLKFAKQPPTEVMDVDNPEGGSFFSSFMKKLNDAEEKTKKAKLVHKGLLENLVSSSTNPMASKMMSFYNRNSQISSLAALKQKMAMKDIFLKGLSSSTWMDKLKSIKPAKLKMSGNGATIPELPQELAKLKK